MGYLELTTREESTIGATSAGKSFRGADIWSDKMLEGENE